MSHSHPGGLTPQSRDAIREAALTITSELSLPILLNRIVGLAREMSGARYAALGIPDPTNTHLVQFITSGMDEEELSKMGELPVGAGLLGELLKPGAKPIRTTNILDHPASAGFSPHHPHMTSFLGVPIRSRGKLLGNLYMTDKIGADEFTEYDQILIETLAAYAAVAIDNARLHQRTQRLAILEERERIGMDLHDGVIQSIYAVGLTLDHARYLLKNGDLETVGERIEEAIDGLNTTIKDIRNYILDLRPSRLQGNLDDGLPDYPGGAGERGQTRRRHPAAGQRRHRGQPADPGRGRQRPGVRDDPDRGTAGARSGEHENARPRGGRAA
jgi:signal transduction histidine kinase